MLIGLGRIEGGPIMWMYLLMLGYFVLLGLAVYLLACAYKDLNRALAKLIKISEQRQNVKYVYTEVKEADP
jgi:hypothetical protein